MDKDKRIHADWRCVLNPCSSVFLKSVSIPCVPYSLFVQVNIRQRRFHAVTYAFLFFSSVVSCGYPTFQFFKSKYLSTIANQQHNLYIELEPVRGLFTTAI